MLAKLLSKIEKFIPKKHRWVLEHAGVRRYSANTGWMFLGQILLLLLSFFIGAWVARYLGPERYGTLSYVAAFVGLFSFVASLGMDGVLHRELVAQPEKRDQILGTSLRLRIIGASLAFLLALGAGIFFAPSKELLILISLYSLNFFLRIPAFLDNYFYAEVKAKQAIKAQFFAALISSALKVGLILSGKGITELIIIYILDSLWGGLFLLRYYKGEGLRFKDWRFDLTWAKSLWRDSWPLMLSSAAAFIYLRIDQVMVGQILGEEAVGIYAVGVKLTEVFYFIPGVICGSLFPAIVNARKASQAVYHSRLKKLYLFLGFLAILISIPSTFLANFFISFVFGAAFIAAAPVLQVYIWSSIGMFLGKVVNQQLMAENRTKLIFYLNLGAMLLNVGLNLIFIQRFGLIGAAVSTLLAYLVAPLSILFISKFKKKDPQDLEGGADDTFSEFKRI